jgi:hypothetical protein
MLTDAEAKVAHLGDQVSELQRDNLMLYEGMYGWALRCGLGTA